MNMTDEEIIAYWRGAYDRMAARSIEDGAKIAKLQKALEPFALISMEGLTEDDVYTTVTTCSEYFHTAAKTYREAKP